MVLSSSGEITLYAIQNEFGGNNPISIDEYYSNNSSGYTAGVSGIPNIGSTIRLSNFRGKGKPIITKYYSWNISSAYGQNGVSTEYVTSYQPLPSDFRRMINFKIGMYFEKRTSGYGVGTIRFGVKNSTQNIWLNVTVNGSYPDGNWYLSSPIEFTNTSWQIGGNAGAGDQIAMFISFIGAANLSNLRFTLELKYTS